MLRNLPVVTRSLIYAFLVSALLSLLVPSYVYSLLPLTGASVLSHFELWRLVTYPFVVMVSLRALFQSVFALFWIAYILMFFAGELETIIHSKRFGIALGTTIVVGGLLYSLIEPVVPLYGPSVVTMFSIAGFSYLWPKREISIFGMFFVKVWVIAVVIYVVSIIPMQGTTLDTGASNLFGPTYGALAAILFFHVAYQQYGFGRSILASITPKATKKKPNYDASDPRAIQIRIDQILDKISTSGMASLSNEERDFLLRNSKTS